MSYQLTERVIKQLCGQTSYDKGAAYYRAGKVTLTYKNAEALSYKAAVRANGSFQVSIDIEHNGDVAAECSCSTFFTFDKHCKHIAAVLLHIRNIQDGHSAAHSAAEKTSAADLIVAENDGLASSMLGLFDSGPPLLSRSGVRTRFDSREILEVAFICKTMPCSGGKHMFGIAMKVGLERLYIVQQIRDFLDHVDQREPHVFTKHFTYNPEIHCFRKEDDAVIRQLIQIDQNEQLYREAITSTSAPHGRVKDDDRTLLVPSFSWEPLLGLLSAAPSVQLQHGDRNYQGLSALNERIPVQFQLDQAGANGYLLDVQGLDEIVVMEDYGIVVADGKLLQLPVEQCKRLAELKLMLENARERRVPIASEQLAPFIERVIPGLSKIGNVRIAPAISDRIVQPQLKAKLYLDRVKDRLLAALEFQYGDIVINPLEAAGQLGEERILMRDGDGERQIVELMEQAAFAKTEGGYIMNDEDSEYEFLYHIAPQLEKLVHVYATSAVKARLHLGPVFPKVKVDVDERTHWLEFEFDIEGIPEGDIRKLLKSLEHKRKYYRLPSGALLPLETEEFQEMIAFMNEVGLHNWDMRGTQFRLPIAPSLQLLDSWERGDSIKLGKSFRRLLDHMRNPDHLDFPVPDSLIPVLRDYQCYGYQWMKTLAHYSFGGILADDMGLGKTVQSIAFLVSVLPEIREQRLPAIIVAPASLVYNWRNELKRFAPELRAVIADGSIAERGLTLRNTAQADVIITSYPLLRKDIARYADQVFHTLILDEAQTFKNYTTQTAQTVKSIQARHRFALTGTPVENRLEELWSIFDAVFPELFASRKSFHELTRETVAKRVRPFLLRRLKSDVLKELPEKIESVQASQLLPEQKKLYAAYLAKLRHETVKHLDRDTFQKNRIKILAGLTRLRQLCCHPALFVEGYTGSSSKFEQLIEIVEECRNAGKRMLIFSQFTEMLGLIGRELGYQGVPYFYLDGHTPASERVELCNRFNEGERELFLISLKAGGTGLNLTGADTVILYDLWWNPAVEQQAADRAHRMGQKNVVQVIRLVTQGTVEDKMYELQQKKKNLIDEVIQPGQEALSSLTEEDIREILKIE
ncbi:RNA polymerase-associated protein RapA [Paenibacillus plantiphilus]|uniref:RNA polymerase-associated protein RapA n=1 Tax=Paenibacillus plantiphilus TaxID=2905650 RepID=A0ABM9CVX5_9BACL|nr:SNF2 helicase associated domain-containing protein [Paenibacillus plantiphilus]CAH1225587.1 RNA polymerase-associated protein RapA [Paenibacillus plantiphilus]